MYFKDGVALTLHIQLQISGDRLQVISSHLKGWAHRCVGRTLRVRVENPSICVCGEQMQYGQSRG